MLIYWRQNFNKPDLGIETSVHTPWSPIECQNFNKPDLGIETVDDRSGQDARGNMAKSEL